MPIKHAQARQIVVKLERSGQGNGLERNDDGVGFGKLETVLAG
jgi:signal transduction histidine kinase